MYRMSHSFRNCWLAVTFTLSTWFLVPAFAYAGDCPPYQYAGSEMWGQAVDMIAENDTLFVLMTHGLLLIDVSNPDTMIRLGQHPILEGRPAQIQRSKGVLYMSMASTQNQRVAFHAYNFDAGGRLNLLDALEVTGSINFIYTSGDSLYLLQNNRMLVFNITQPTNIQQVYRYDEDGFAPFSMVKIDSLLVFANVQLLIHDARPGTFMERMSFLPPRNSHPLFLPYYNQLRTCGPYLVATEQQNNFSFSTGWVQLLDLSDPLQPKRFSNYQIPRRIHDMSWGMNQIRVASDLGVHAFSVVNDTQLQLLSHFPDPGGAGGIESDFNSAYTFTRDTMVTVSAPPNCKNCWCNSTGRDSVYNGDLLTLDYLPDGDVCVPSIYPLPGIASYGYIWDDYLYTLESTRKNQINIYNISLQDSIIPLEPFRFPHPVDNFGIDSNLLWIGANFRNLYVYQIEGARQFVLIDSATVPYQFLPFDPSDSILYFLTRTSITDYQFRISELNSMGLFHRSHLEIADTLISIASAGQYVAIGRTLVPAVLIDASNKSFPNLICSLSTPSYAYGVTGYQSRFVAFQEGFGTSTGLYELDPSACIGPVATHPASTGHSYARLGEELYTYRRGENIEIWNVDSLPYFAVCDTLPVNDELLSITPTVSEIFTFERSGIHRYRRSPITDVEIDPEDVTPSQSSFSVELSPNPTNFRFRAVLQSASERFEQVSITVYDALGRTLFSDEIIFKGNKSWSWPGEKGGSPSSGVYFLRFQFGSEVLVRKAVMLK